MFESLSRGWTMTKASFKVLSLDKEILVLPVLAGVIMLAAVVGVGYGAFGLGLVASGGGALLTLFLIYLIAYTAVIYFNAATIEMATIRFNGGDPVLMDGLKKASSKFGRIVQWAIVAATVGLIFAILRQMARDRDSFFGQLLVGFMETAWNVATFFVVPLAVYQDLGPLDAIKASTRRVKRTFGESVSGMATTGIVFFLLGIPGALLLYLGAGNLVLMAIGAVWIIVVAALNMAVSGILVAALYKYSTDGNMPEAYTNQGIQAESLAW